MRATCVLVSALMACAAPAVWADEPVKRSKPEPPYYADARFDAELQGERIFVGNHVNGEKALVSIGALTGQTLLVPGYVRSPYITLAPDHRRLRDAMDALAELAQGEWQKVEDVYVLVLDPHLLDVASHERKDEAINGGFRLLIDSLTERQLQSLRLGGVLRAPSMTPQQRRYIRDLGTLAYYRSPDRIDPKAVRGEGVYVSTIPSDSGPEPQLMLPFRDGKTFPVNKLLRPNLRK